MTDAWLVVKRAFHEFARHEGTDSAAALTYYAVLAFFPGAIAVLSLLVVISQGAHVTEKALQTFQSLAPQPLADTLTGPLTSLLDSNLAGIGFVVGLGGAVWSASGYVSAFGRRINGVYGVREGRSFVVLVVTQLAVTVLAVLFMAVVTMVLVLSSIHVQDWLGPAVGGVIDTWVFWNVLTVVVVLVLAVITVAGLYSFASNVRFPLRIVTPGSAFAIGLWVLATALFFLYVQNFAQYDAVYGSLAGIIVFLLWLYITNIALVLGAHLDQEILRARQLAHGVNAERSVEVRVRSSREFENAEKERVLDVLSSQAMKKRNRDEE